MIDENIKIKTVLNNNNNTYCGQEMAGKIQVNSKDGR